MRPSIYLYRLRYHATRRLYKLRILAASACILPFEEADSTISYTTIGCLNIWDNFSRAYFLSCSMSPWRENGSQVTISNPSIRNFNDAIEASIRTCKNWVWKRGNWNRRDEPPWHDPQTLIRSCSEIGCSNYIEIQNAFSIPTKVFQHLPTYRNFYAHRNDDTAQKAKEIARQYSIPVRGHPSQILCTPAYGRPQVLLLDWIDDIRFVLELLCA